MIIFVPSWYDQTMGWQSVYGPWHQKNSGYEFDDTINQVRMFRMAGEDIVLMCLSYMPCLRHFLHRQCIYPTPYWSVFDEMQGTTYCDPGTLSYQELQWPHNVEWIYTSRDVRAYVDDHLYAVVEFYSDGSMCWIDFYRDETICRRDVYDDRGFCSSSLQFSEGKPVKREYWGCLGEKRFTENLISGEIIISKESYRSFRKDHYVSLAELIDEKVKDWLLERKGSTVIIAANQLHNQLVLQECRYQTVILSFFEDRYCLDNKEELQRDTARAPFVVTDTERSAKNLEAAGVKSDIYDISPFDTRLPLGTSQKVREQKIFMPVEGLDVILLEKALHQILDFMNEHEDVNLTLGINAENEKENQQVVQLVEKLLHEGNFAKITFEGLSYELLNEGKKGERATKQKHKRRIEMVSYLSEFDLIDILSDTRLILDVRDQPDLYLQIAGISSGIPQVNYRYTRYIEHQKDGFIIQNIDHITEALEYYLSGLSHWNEALVYCVQTAAEYAGSALVEKWKELLSDCSWDY